MTDNPESDQLTDESQDNADRPADDVQVRLSRVEDALHRHDRPWFRTPSNVISILAVVASIGVFVLAFVSQTLETKFQKLQQLGQVIDQVSRVGNQRSRAVPLGNSSQRAHECNGCVRQPAECPR